MTDYDFLNASLNNDEGAYLVPEPLAKQLLSNINDYGNLLPMLRKWPMTSLTEKIPILSSGSSATYTSAEGQNKANTQPVFSQITLSAEELAAVVVVTERLLMVSNIDNLLSVIQDDLRNAFISAKEKEYFGYGGSVYTHNLTDYTPVAHTIAYGTGDDLLVDISSAMQAIEEHGYLNMGFITHPAVKHLLRTLRDDNGLPILNPATANSPETLFGFPIRYSTYMEKTGSPSGYELFVADWSKVIEGNLQELRLAKSTDATITLADSSTVNLFQKNMVAIKAWLYSAFEIVDANALAKVTGLCA